MTPDRLREWISVIREAVWVLTRDLVPPGLAVYLVISVGPTHLQEWHVGAVITLVGSAALAKRGGDE